METSGVRYAKSEAVEVAYEIVGAGPIDLVYVPGFISHLDLYKEIPSFFSIIEHLTRFARVLIFDKRGTGLSSRVGFGSIADRADDIRAVMDHAGWDRANLMAISEGGPLSMLFAASHPQRVSKLALYASYASLPHLVDAPEFDIERYLDRIERNWGSGDVISQFIGVPDDPEVVALQARYERAATTPGVAREIMRANLYIDVREIVPTVAIPTLVMHNMEDPIVPVDCARFIASLLPDCRLVEFPGDYHAPRDARAWAPALQEIERFFTGQDPVPLATERVLATVLFTDIVDSTARAAELGDRQWRSLLDSHDAEAARVVGAYAGRVVKHTGDGLLATFDSPARAVQCAQKLHQSMDRVGVPIRAGLHAGEIEQRGDDVGGIGVHIASRVAGQADAGEVLVSRTVRDLVVGSDLTFEDRGCYELKGVPDEWQLYAAT